MPSYLEPRREGFLLHLHVVPGAVRTELAGEHGDRLKVRVAAPAAKGRANQELLRFLSAALGLPRSSLELVRGPTSRRKTVRLASQQSSESLAALLAELAGKV